MSNGGETSLFFLAVAVPLPAEFVKVWWQYIRTYCCNIFQTLINRFGLQHKIKLILRVGAGVGFAFDEGQALSEHTVPFEAMVQVLDGRVELTIGGENVPATAGQVVVMPAEVPHAVRAPVRFKMLLTMIRG